jgi:hypothetical protein
MPAMFELRHSRGVVVYARLSAQRQPCVPRLPAPNPPNGQPGSAVGVDSLFSLCSHSAYAADAIHTTTRRQRGHGHHRQPYRRLAGCCMLRTGVGWFAAAVTARPWRSYPTSFDGVPMLPDVLRRNARCSACGRRGASLQLPSWGDASAGWKVFPT